MARHLIIGASRGIGAAVARHLAAAGHEVLGVSRGPAVAGVWVPADVATDAGLSAVAAAVGPGPLDSLLYLGGTWEAGAFTAAYDFARSPAEETRRVIAVNLVAPILLTQALAGNLAQAGNPRVVFIGSLTAMPGTASVEVANSASKFGLMGAAEALTLALRGRGVAVTVVNPGNVATPEVEGDIAEGRFGPQVPVPMADLIAVIDMVLALGPASVPGVVTLAQKRPEAA